MHQLFGRIIRLLFPVIMLSALLERITTTIACCCFTPTWCVLCLCLRYSNVKSGNDNNGGTVYYYTEAMQGGVVVVTYNP